MQKTGIKTFVYSFSASLFMIFSVNGIVWHTRPSTPESTKISGKNIMLFLNGTSTSLSAKSAPVKKINLTKLEDIPSLKEDLPPSNIVYAPDEKDVLILADTNTSPPIPLEVSPQEQKTGENIILASAEIPDIFTPPSPAGLEKQGSSFNKAPVSANGKDKIKIPASAPRILPAKQPQEKSFSDKAPPPFPLQKDINTPERQNYLVQKSSESPSSRIALADARVPIEGMLENAPTNKKNAPAKNAEQWETMASKKPADNSPWIVARSAGTHPNSLLKEEHFYKAEKESIRKALDANSNAKQGTELLLASETVKNLLIPIPEDILNDDDLTPQLVSSNSPEGQLKEAAIDAQIKKRQKQKEEEKDTPKKQNSVKNSEEITPIKPVEQVPTAQNDKKKSLLSSLSTIFNGSSQSRQDNKSSDNSAANAQSKRGKSSRGKIMPTEMRLSFQPNRAEISGQTLRWIQAFAAQAANDKKTGIEIRIDGTNAMELQQKRLNLLHNILMNKGVDYGKINTVYTNREPNSFIIRTTTLSMSQTGNIGGTGNRGATYYQQW